MPIWLLILLLLPAALFLGRCALSLLSEERSSGTCTLCLLIAAFVFLGWQKDWFGLDRLALSIQHDLGVPDDAFHPESAVGTLVKAGGIFLLAFGLLHLLARFVRRWDRRRFARRPRYFTRSWVPWMYAPDGDAAAREAADAWDTDAWDGDAGGFDGDVGGGDAGGVD